MSKKFDSEAYVARWDAKMAPIMLSVIAVAFVAVVVLNVKTRPSCLRHEYIFCGTEEVLKQDAPHHKASDESAKGHGHE